MADELQQLSPQVLWRRQVAQRLGAGSLVLYDTRMEDGSKLDDLSLLMKGEVLPAGTFWAGVPARKKMN